MTRIEDLAPSAQYAAQDRPRQTETSPPQGLQHRCVQPTFSPASNRHAPITDTDFAHSRAATEPHFDTRGSHTFLVWTTKTRNLIREK